MNKILIKKELFKKQNGKCYWCRCKLKLTFGVWSIRYNNGKKIALDKLGNIINSNYNPPHLDHLIPKSQEGSDSLENLVLTCGWCNSSKGIKSVEEFTKYLKKFGKIK